MAGSCTGKVSRDRSMQAREMSKWIYDSIRNLLTMSAFAQLQLLAEQFGCVKQHCRTDTIT